MHTYIHNSPATTPEPWRGMDPGAVVGLVVGAAVTMAALAFLVWRSKCMCVCVCMCLCGCDYGCAGVFSMEKYVHVCVCLCGCDYGSFSTEK